ncbi:hypothetical protein ICW40_01135 [Actinotalea ferrariae]|nr:hypothetical protein [Actinotalea ferrariae]
MPNTLDRAYPYPSLSPGTPNNPPLHFQQLAEALDADVQSIVDDLKGAGDVAWAALGTLGGSYGAGYAAYTTAPWNGVRVRRHNGVVYIAAAVTKNAATVANETILTLPAGLRPPTNIQGTASAGAVAVKTTGEVYIATPGPGTTFSFGFSYPVS